MKIAICGSVQFAREMIEIKSKLEALGHTFVLPKDIDQYASGKKSIESKWEKQKGDLFKNYWQEIKASDAILLVNISKNEIKHYIGGSALIEMAYTHIFDKKIYLLNPVPKTNYQDKIKAMKPEILNNNLKKIPYNFKFNLKDSPIG